MRKFLTNLSIVKLRTFLVIGLFLLAAWLLSYNLNKPFEGIHDWNGARYGNIARNYLKYGLVATKLGQVENSGVLKVGEFQFFTHYPPLLPLMIATSFKIFGVTEWAARLIPLLFSVGTVVMLYLVGSRLWSDRVGIVTSLLALTTPLIVYFGKNPVHEPVVVFFILLAFLSYLKGSWKLFLVALSLAHLTTWAGFFLLPAMIFVAILKKQWDQFRRLLPLLLIPAGIFALHLIHTFWLTGQLTGGDLLGAFLQRSNLSEAGKIAEFTLSSYFDQIRLWITTVYGPVISLLALVGLVSLISRKATDAYWQLITLGIFGVAYFIIFPNAAYIHNYLTFYLLPFLAFSSALGLEMVSRHFFKKFSALVLGVIIMVMLVERLEFRQALEASRQDALAVEVGRAINLFSAPDETVLVSPRKFSYSADNFLKFYGDRKLVYSDDSSPAHHIRVIVDQKDGKFEIIRKP